MSTFTVRATSRRAPRTPFCSVCKKAGKTESEYTSHFVRDRPGPNGRVVCPTLLSTECRYCHELGHTKTHCPKLALKAENERQRERVWHMNERQRKAENRLRAQVSKTEEPTLAFRIGHSVMHVPIKSDYRKSSARSKTFKSNGAFAALYDSDEEEINILRPTPLTVSVAIPAPVTGRWKTGTGFAGKAASKPAPEPKPEPIQEMTSISASNIQTLEQVTADFAESVKGISAKITKAGGWGDYMMESDSDEEEEEFDSLGRPLDDNSAW